MILEAMCKIDARIGKNFLSETVTNDINSINAKLIEMGIENTTGLDPSNKKKFERQMKTAHKKLRDLSFTNLAKDIETEDLYVLIKESEYDVRSVLKTLKSNRRLQNKNISI